jgi:hypothetical protein
MLVATGSVGEAGQSLDSRFSPSPNTPGMTVSVSDRLREPSFGFGATKATPQPHHLPAVLLGARPRRREVHSLLSPGLRNGAELHVGAGFGKQLFNPPDLRQAIQVRPFRVRHVDHSSLLSSHTVHGTPCTVH